MLHCRQRLRLRLKKTPTTPEGGNEASAITTFGMSEFHFSQNGRELDLRPGVRATLSMDLAGPYIMTDENAFYEDATEGAIMPLWYYDTEQLVWREEGEVVIAADSESNSGFTATGEVSHFSYWNIDWMTPFIKADIHVLVVDQNGAPRNDVEVLTYYTLVRIPPEAGESVHGKTSTWQNSDVLTPQKNEIKIIGNDRSRVVLTVPVVDL